MRKGGDEGFADLQLDGLGELVKLDVLGLGAQARLVDHAGKLPRAAVGDGRFIGVQLDDGVVHAEAGEGGEDVLDGVNLGVGLAERGRAVGLDDVLDAGLDLGLALEVHAAETDARIAAAGRKVMVTRLPLCRPMPEKVEGC